MKNLWATYLRGRSDETLAGEVRNLNDQFRCTSRVREWARFHPVCDAGRDVHHQDLCQPDTYVLEERAAGYR